MKDDVGFMTKTIKMNKDVTKTIYLFIVMLIYKLSLELGCWYLLQNVYRNSNVYRFQFDLSKFILGLAWTIVLFFLINHKERKPSAFFMELQFVIAIVPITVIFAFSDENILYYNAICVSFAVCEILILLSEKVVWPQINIVTRLLVVVFYIITVIVYLDIIIENGMFTLDAFNIYNVYEIRSNFKLNKYIGYMFDWQYVIITPFFIIRAIKRRKYFSGVIFVVLQLLAYLYAAQKTILFIIPLVIGLGIVSEWKGFQNIIYSALTFGIVLISIGSRFSEVIYKVYDLIVRRVFLLPANLKFIYYDFFSENSKIGLAGTLWGKFLDIEHPYKERIGIIISKEYFNKPEMNSNTGFLAEGYYRFDLFGIILVLVLFAIILILLDNFAELNGYSFAVSVGFFPIFLLNDGGLIDPLIFGHFTILVLLCIFYNGEYDFKNNKIHIKKRRK